MNSPIMTTELDPAEQRRRTLARNHAERIARRMGFRSVAARPGFWYHEDEDQGIVFNLSGPHPIENEREALNRFAMGMFKAGIEDQRKQAREALGL